MFALADGSASRSSLLLNLEGVLTALLAWWVFREHLDKRIAAGMGVITVGAFVLAWKPQQGVGLDRGAVLVAMACLAWAVDNNLTRKISGGDAAAISALKGGVAGAVNCDCRRRGGPVARAESCHHRGSGRAGRIWGERDAVRPGATGPRCGTDRRNFRPRHSWVLSWPSSPSVSRSPAIFRGGWPADVRWRVAAPQRAARPRAPARAVGS